MVFLKERRTWKMQNALTRKFGTLTKVNLKEIFRILGKKNCDNEAIIFDLNLSEKQINAKCK